MQRKQEKSGAGREEEGRDGGGEGGRGLDELVVDEVLRPAVSGGEVVEDVGEREEAGTGEDRAVAWFLQWPGS